MHPLGPYTTTSSSSSSLAFDHFLCIVELLPNLKNIAGINKCSYYPCIPSTQNFILEDSGNCDELT